MSKTLYKQKMVRQNNRNGLRERFGYGSLDTGLSSNGGMLPSLEWIHTPDKASGITGAYYATPPQQPTGVLLTYSHEITLQNLAAPNNPNFLASCGGDSICPSNHSVSTFTNNPGDYRTETWRILDSEGNAIAHTNDSTSNVNYGDTIMLQSVNSGWILETCGLSNCNNGHQLYNVSTYNGLRNPMHNVQRWKIQHPLTPSLTGPIYTGDDIKLVNLAGVTSYLNTCNSKSGCGTGQLYGVNTCKLGSDDASATTSNWRIRTNIPTITVDQCKAVCLGDTQCESFDYNKETSQCDIGYFAAGKDGVAELNSYPGKWDYYERKLNYTREDLNPGYTDWYAMAPGSRTWSIHEKEKAMPGINNDIGEVIGTARNGGVSEGQCRQMCTTRVLTEGCKSIEWKPHWNVTGGTCRLSSKQAGKNGAPELIDYVQDEWGNTWNYSEMDEIPGYPEAHPLPDKNWWVGSKAPYYDFPECHIPYGKPCNWTSPKIDLDDEINLKGGECCFGASSCVGGTCNTHDNEWNYAHDIMGTDAEGCDLQPGSQCNYNLNGSGCCKDYREYGGSNWGCRDEKCTKLKTDGTSDEYNDANRPYQIESDIWS
jgi:hypothetical protein